MVFDLRDPLISDNFLRWRFERYDELEMNLKFMSLRRGLIKIFRSRLVTGGLPISNTGRDRRVGGMLAEAVDARLRECMQRQ